MTRLVTLPSEPNPVLSILMVLYRGGAMAVDALAAVADCTDIPYEVIVVDNASPDASGSLVRLSVRGLRYLPQTVNLGFGPAMNVAASHARGSHLCFLNPDTMVHRRWASTLVSATNRPGAVGATPLLLNVDGTVQEAGGVIDGLGNSHALGCGDWVWPGLLESPRVVDYASAAALVVRRAAFEAVGGFDERYRLAYFEDADLAFSLAEHGGAIWFEPAARVTHRRGGTAVGRIAADLGHENKQRFREKWASVLAKQPTDPAVLRSRLSAVVD